MVDNVYANSSVDLSANTLAEVSTANQIDVSPDIQKVEEIKEAVAETFSETRLPDTITDLRDMLENLSAEVDSWRAWHKNDYLEAIETLKSQVEKIQNEWNTVSSSIEAQRENLESHLQSFPSIIETATLKGLSLRVIHLEQLISELFQESQSKRALEGSRRHYFVSLAALTTTIILWGIFIVINVIK